MRLENTQVVITGAASGIGFALLTELAQKASAIVAADINKSSLYAAVQQLGETKARVIPFVGDVGTFDVIDDLFVLAVTEMGGIDLFFANAGFAYYEPFIETDWQRLEQIFKVNTLSPLYTLRKMAVLHGPRPYRIVVTASAIGLLAYSGYATYGATKAALHRFAESYRTELKERATLTLVYPIGTRTHFFDHASAPQPWPTQEPSHVARAIIRGIQQDNPTIFPSRLFLFIMVLDRVFPPVRWLIQLISRIQFDRWRAQRSR